MDSPDNASHVVANVSAAHRPHSSAPSGSSNATKVPPPARATPRVCIPAESSHAAHAQHNAAGTLT